MNPNDLIARLNELESDVESTEDEAVHDLVSAAFEGLREELSALASERGEG